MSEGTHEDKAFITNRSTRCLSQFNAGRGRAFSMANPKHLEIIRKGVKAVREWRKHHPEERLDLSEAILDRPDLDKTNLSEANLMKSTIKYGSIDYGSLAKANMSHATIAFSALRETDMSFVKFTKGMFFCNTAFQINLANADLHDTDLSGTTFLNANLSGADLSHTRNLFTAFTQVDLKGTSLRKAMMPSASFSGCELVDTDFTNSSIDCAVFAGCDLSKSIGLETVKHQGESMISLDTIILSFRGANDTFTPEVKKFFKNAGVPTEILEEMPKMIMKVQYLSCFVCYGEPDQEFAESLVTNLRNKGVSCWLYSMDAIPGKRTWREITEKRREADKMVVVCSVRSLVRDGVKKEIEEQVDEDPEKIVPISRDTDWKQEGFVVRRGQKDLKPLLLERNYADFCEKSKYKDSLNRLLKGLRRT